MQEGMIMNKKLFLPLLAAALLSSCKNITSDERSFYAMDTYITLKAYGENAAQADEAAKKMIEEFSDVLDPYKEGSEVFELNLNAQGDPDTEIRELMEVSLKLYERTEGAFDITVFPLKKLWGFSDNKLYIPSEMEIEEANKLVGSDRITVSDSGHIELLQGTQIDPGAVAKGFACDEVKKIYEEQGVKSAILNLGGNVLTIGNRPDKSRWSVGISDPDNSSGYLLVLSVCDKCVVTSGNYQRYLTDGGGKRYGHIIDPATGSPADSDIVSATVICASGTVADALSTAIFVMGSEAACEFYRKSDDFEMVLYLDDGRLLVSEGLSGAVSAQKTEIQTIKH